MNIDFVRDFMILKGKYFLKIGLDDNEEFLGFTPDTLNFKDIFLVLEYYNVILKNGLYDLNYKGYSQAMMINCYKKYYTKGLYGIKE